MDLYIQETGEDNEEIILFLHGAGLAGWMWDKQLKAFKDYHCIIPDLPGHGNSRQIKPFTIKRSAEILIELIKKKSNNRKVHLVGISIGAQIILQILAMDPDIVDHALISGTLVNNQPTESYTNLFNYFMKVYNPDKDIDFFIKAYMRMYHIPKTLFRKFRESTYIINHNSLTEILKENMFFKMPNGLEDMDVPVLVMIGEKDYEIIKKSAQDILNVLPNSKGEVALNVGHLWNIEKPEFFNDTLKAWIDNSILSNGFEKLKF